MGYGDLLTPSELSDEASGPPSGAPKGGPGAPGGAKIPSHRPASGSAESQGWHEQGPHGDDRISIPGTHVPAWVVVAIVVGVVALLAATAFFLLR